MFNAPASKFFQASDEFMPADQFEFADRLEYYLVRLSFASVELVKEFMLALTAQVLEEEDKVNFPLLEDAHLAGSSKELLCVWLHQEALEQGGEAMPEWLLYFLRAALFLTDAALPDMKMNDVFDCYDRCESFKDFCELASDRVASHVLPGVDTLGFTGQKWGLVRSPVRNAILSEALALPASDIRRFLSAQN